MAYDLSRPLFCHLGHDCYPLCPSPSGAQSVIAVTDGARAKSLGFLFLIFPALLASLFMVLVAVLLNNLSSDPKRQYPTYWVPYNLSKKAATGDPASKPAALVSRPLVVASEREDARRGEVRSKNSVQREVT